MARCGRRGSTMRAPWVGKQVRASVAHPRHAREQVHAVEVWPSAMACAAIPRGNEKVTHMRLLVCSWGAVGEIRVCQREARGLIHVGPRRRVLWPRQDSASVSRRALQGVFHSAVLHLYLQHITHGSRLANALCSCDALCPVTAAPQHTLSGACGLLLAPLRALSHCSHTSL